MVYIIYKQWPDNLTTRQRANLLTYPTRLAAEHAATRLARLFPGRLFYITPLPSTSEGND